MSLKRAKVKERTASICWYNVSNPRTAVLRFGIALLLGIFIAGPALLPTLTTAKRTDIAPGLFFSADVTGATNAARRIDLDGSNEEVILGPLALNQLIYVESENRFYGTALDNAIRRINADGSGIETIVTGLDGPNSLALDLASGKMYWIDQGSGFLKRGLEVRRANMDGSQQELIIDSNAGFGQFDSLTLDLANDKLYVVNDDEIFRANLDGSAPETFATATGGVNPELSCPLIDASNSKVYWVQDGGSSGNAFYRANLDGSNPQPIITLANFPDVTCPIFNADGTELLWADKKSGTIQRADLDGANQATILTGLATTGQLILASDGNLYWYELDSGEIRIRTAPRGTGNSAGAVATLVEDLNLLRGFAPVPALNKVFWINQTTAFMEFGQVGTDGSNQSLVLRAPRDIRGIDLDRANEKIYFTNSGVIARADMDGSNVEVLVEDLGTTEAIALDLVNGKMYWSIGGATEKIQRANLDGSDVEDVFVHSGSGTAIYRALVVDPTADSLYWTYYIFGGSAAYTGSIWRAGLDGSNPDELIPGLGVFGGLALDRDASKLYWTDSGTDLVQRANVDGTEVETISSVPNSVLYDIAVDAPNGHLYWSDATARTITRTSLTGDNATVLYAGPAVPYALVVVADPPDSGETDPAVYLPLMQAD